MPEQFLRNAEQSSVDKKKERQSDGAVDEARSAEEGQSGDGNSTERDSFRSSVTGKHDKKNTKTKLSGLKKKGPLVAILGLLTLLAGLIFAAQSIMPFAIVNRMIEEFNTAGISSVLRSDNILSYQMSSAGSDFGLTAHQKSSLAENEIFPIDTGGGTVLVYKASLPDSWKIAYADRPSSPDLGDIKNKLTSQYEGYSFNQLTPITIKDAMQDGDFKIPYTTASKTWRGGNAGWYDTLNQTNESIRNYTRSRFWYTNTRTLSSNLLKTTKALNYRKTISGKLWTSISGRRTLHETIAQSMAGTKIGKALGVKTVNTTKINNLGNTKIADQLINVASGLNIAAGVTETACQALQMVSKAQTLIAAIQNMQYMNLASGVFEAVQSTQVGDSDGEPMREYMEALTINDESGKNGMMSDGMSALMTGSTIDGDSASVQRTNAENAMRNINSSTSNGNIIINILREAATSITDILSAITVCNKVAAGLNVVSTVVSVAVGIATAGIGSIIEAVCMSVVSFVVNKELAHVANAIIGWIWDEFSDSIAQNVATDWLGEDYGNALYSAGSYFIQSQHQIGSGTPAGREEVIAYRQEQNRVIAEEAEYQRSIRSPFDINSQYTFLGSIVYNLIPIATTSGVGNIIKNIGTLMTNSVSAILPTASAVATTDLALDFGNCPTLESIGASCDKMGRVYIVSDSSAINGITHEEAINKLIELGDITVGANGTYTVKEKSDAEKFCAYCSERLSNWGQSDANIMQSIAESRNQGWWTNIPILGNFISKIRTLFADDSDDVNWIVGKKCVNSSENSEFWESKGKYYQVFFQDERIIENAVADEGKRKSAAKEVFGRKLINNTDDSPEGELARYSGMTKEDVIATIDFINAMNYIANYHPEERFAFGAEEVDDTVYYEETGDEFARIIALEPKYIVYDTLRNKATIG